MNETLKSRIQNLCDEAKLNGEVFVFGDEVYSADEAYWAMLGTADDEIDDEGIDGVTEDDYIDKMSKCACDQVYTTDIISDGDRCIYEREYNGFKFQIWAHKREDGDVSYLMVCFDQYDRQRGWQEIDSDGYSGKAHDGFPFSDDSEEENPDFDFEGLDDFFNSYYGDRSFEQIVAGEI